MVQPAPAAVRTIEAINYLAAHPGQAFNLSELSKRLGINMASLLAILQALTDAGYVVRHPRHKTYALGPSLVAVGHAALARHVVIDAARPAMDQLAADYETECVSSVLVGDEMVIVATEGVAPAGARDIRVGMRLPLVPPLGAVFIAWADDETVAAWLARSGAGAKGADRKRHHALLATVRARGYSLGLVTGEGARLGRALHALAEAPANRPVLGSRIPTLVSALGAEYAVADLDADTTYSVGTIAAPVFDADSTVALALTLNGFPRPLLGREIDERAERVVALARDVTKQIHGRPPVG